MKQHPLRDEPLIVYENPQHGAVGFFGTDKKYPIYIIGQDAAEVMQKGEAFRSDLLEKHEKTYLKRRAAAEKARAARARTINGLLKP